MRLFSDGLAEAIIAKRSVICVGLDPRISDKPGMSTIPKHFITDSDDLSEAIFRFYKGIIDSTIDIIPVYKPQIAFFELYEALDALKKLIKYIHDKGGLVILDAKRSDIGSTAAAYAKSLYDNFKADAVTVNAYFGIDGVKPFLEYIPEGKGVIILFKTSNKSSGEFQDLLMVDDVSIYDQMNGEGSFVWNLDQNTLQRLGSLRLVRAYIKMTRLARKWALDPQLIEEEYRKGKYGYSSIGGVVGATYPEQLKAIRKEFPEAFLLIPGYGAQGGTAEDVIAGVNEDGLGAIVNSSRAINFAYQNERYVALLKELYPDVKADLLSAEAARIAAEEMRNAINQKLKECGRIAYNP